MIIYPHGNNLNPLNQNFVNLIVNFCWLYTSTSITPKLYILDDEI